MSARSRSRRTRVVTIDAPRRPRGSLGTLGRVRLRSPWRGLGTLAVLGTVAIVGIAWWVLTRPASVALAAVPADSTITFAGNKPTRGTFAADELEPGTYRVTVSRPGFRPVSTSVTLERGRLSENRYVLIPLPFRMRFISRPKGALVRVTRAGGAPVTGTTPCRLTIPAGAVTVSVTKSGFNAFGKKFFLESEQAFDLLLDPKGQLVHALGSVNCAGAPKGVALTPDGREAWSAILNGPPSIQICDPLSGRITGSIDLGRSGAVEVIFNRAGTRAYASQMETKLHETSTVFEIDVASRKVLRTMDTASTMTKVIALSPDEKTLYSANWAGNDVSIMDLASGTVRERIPVARTPRGLWPTADGKTLYVAGFAKGDLEKVDLATGDVTKIFTSGGAMRHLVADEKRGLLYASDMGKNAIWVVDMKTDAVRRLRKTDHKPNTIDLSPDGRVLFVSNRGANNPTSYYLPGYEWGSILLLDTATGKPLDAVVGGNQCTALDLSGDGKMLVFSDFLDNRLRVYEVPSSEVLASGHGGRFRAHFADLKKSSPGTAASSGSAG